MLCSNITWFQITFLLLIKLFIYLFHPWQLAQIKQVLFCLSKTWMHNSLSRDFSFIITPQARPNQASQCCLPDGAMRCRTSGDMPSVPEHLPLSDCTYSLEQLVPRSVNTVFSLAHKDTLWTLQPAPGNCEHYWQAILLMTSGGSVLICGMVLSGLYFAGLSTMATKILAPALLSVGLMVLVVGLVLMPVTRQMRTTERN